MTDPKNQTNTTDAALPPVDDYATATEALREKLADAQTPGYQAEFDPDEADRAGAFAEDALSEGDALASKQEREEAAAERLFGLLPEATGTRLRALWDEYERGDTPEARYVMAVDRMAPMLLNLAEGGSTWREHGITRNRVIARNGPHVEPALPDVWALALQRLDAATEAGAVGAD